MGIFSMIDTLMNRPMEEILAKLPLSEDIKGALLGDEGHLRDFFELVLAYEKGDWDKTFVHADRLKINQPGLHNNYIKSLEWANQLLID